jgi:hypothetical protein
MISGTPDDATAAEFAIATRCAGSEHESGIETALASDAALRRHCVALPARDCA